MRVTADGSYWAVTLSAMLVISLGMAGAVAPLTTAVLTSVDARHAGVASGFNCAMARTGGLIATALAGAILVAHGPGLQAAFHGAMVAGAVSAAAASTCACLWLGKTNKEKTA